MTPPLTFAAHSLKCVFDLCTATITSVETYLNYEVFNK